MITYPNKSLYLACPMTGRTMAEARNSWQHEFRDYMPDHIHCLSPMRGYEGISEDEEILAAQYNHHPLVTDKGIVTQDYNDVSTSDAVIANVLGATRASIGTTGEIAWAFILKKPVILIIEDEGNPHDHGFIRAMSGYRVTTVKQAADLAVRLFTPGL